MGINLGKKTYIFSVILIWFLFLLRAIYLFIEIERSFILVELFLAGVALQLSLVSFIKNIYTYKLPKFIDWYKLATFVYLIFHYLRIANDLSNPKNSIWFQYTINENFIVESLSVVIVGLLGLNLIDYMFRIRFTKKDYYERINPLINFKYILRSEKVVVFSSFIFLILQFILIGSGLIGYGSESFISEKANVLEGNLSFLFQLFFFLSSLYIYIYSINVFFNNDITIFFKNSFKIYLVLNVLINLFAGQKGGIITTFIVVLTTYFYSGRKFNLRNIFIFIPIIWLVFTFVPHFRLKMFENPSKGRDDLFIEVFNDILANKEIKNDNSDFLSRVSMFQYFVYAVEHETKWDDYKHINRYMYLPISFLPRFLIKDKPTSDTGVKFNNMVMGTKNNSITPTSYGWAYFEGGSFFVFITFCFLGIFMSIFQYVISNKTRFYSLFYFCLTFSLLTIENDIYFQLSGMFSVVLLYILFSKLLFKPNMRKNI